MVRESTAAALNRGRAQSNFQSKYESERGGF